MLFRSTPGGAVVSGGADSARALTGIARIDEMAKAKAVFLIKVVSNVRRIGQQANNTRLPISSADD